MADNSLITQSQLGTAVQRLNSEIDESLEGVFDGDHTGTIGTTWTEDETTGVKTQTVPVAGIQAKNNVIVHHDDTSIDGTSDGYATYVDEENQFLTYITNGYGYTVAGGITFVIFGDAPTVEIPIVVEVI